MRQTSRPRLSARQAEIAQLLAKGKSNREMAAALFLSERTVESHVTALFNKFNVSSRTEVVAAVLRRPFDAADGLAARTNLPLESSPMIGREGDVAEIRLLLEHNRLVTATGAGGVGKTQTALAIGHAILQTGRTGVAFVEFAPIADGLFVGAAVANAVNVQELPGRPLVDTLVARLRQHSLLLVFDNCEHVIAEAAALADALLRECPRLRILATSREPLRIPGERTYRLPSLPVPAAGEIAGLSAAKAVEFAAVALFVQRAQAVDHGFIFRDDNASDVAEICRRLDGIPLAIELAAARMKVLSAHALCARLDQRFRILTRGARTALPRHQTMRALIDWSYDLLAPPERRLFERLSVFVGGCTLVTAVAVCADAVVAEHDILDLLSSLVDKSLVAADLSGREPRYKLLESARQYAAERLAERGEASAALALHAAAFVELAEQLENDYDLAPDSAWYARARLELENWRAALTWALSERRNILFGQRFASALCPVWKNLALAEGQRWLAVALQSVSHETPGAVLAHLEYAAADIADVSARHDAALNGSRRALTLYETLDDALGAARAKALLGWALDRVSRPAAEIEPVLQSALEAARALGNSQLTGTVLRALGVFRSRSNKYPEARAYLTEALEIFDALGAEFHAALVTHYLAVVEFEAGNLEEAVRLETASLVSLGDLGFTAYLTKARNMLAEYLIAADRWDEARGHAQEALDLVTETQQSDVIIWSLHHLAAIAALSSVGSARAGAQHTIAALLLGYVDANLPTIGRRRHSDEQQEYVRTLDVLRDTLGEDHLARLMATGAAMSTDEAVERARSIEIGAR